MASYAEELELLEELKAKKKENIELDEYERGVFDTLSWIIDGSDRPEII